MGKLHRRPKPRNLNTDSANQVRGRVVRAVVGPDLELSSGSLGLIQSRNTVRTTELNYGLGLNPGSGTTPYVLSPPRGVFNAKWSVSFTSQVLC